MLGEDGKWGKRPLHKSKVLFTIRVPGVYLFAGRIQLPAEKHSAEESFMRVWKIAFSGALAAILLLTAVTPAVAAPQLADKVPVQFQNKTGASIVITLTGPTTVYLTLNTGKTKSELIPGTYHYSYFACDKTNTGTFKAKTGATLTLPKCKKSGGGSGKITVKNATDGTITIYLIGPKNYVFYVPIGTTKLDVVRGKYSFTAYGCGDVDTGTIKTGGHLSYWCIYY